MIFFSAATRPREVELVHSPSLVDHYLSDRPVRLKQRIDNSDPEIYAGGDFDAKLFDDELVILLAAEQT
jgi:hypothetical protein